MLTVIYSVYIKLMLRMSSSGPVSFLSFSLRSHLHPSHQHHLSSHLCSLGLFISFSSLCLLIGRKEDDVFIAKLPTFEKRCETPAGMVEVKRTHLCLTKTNRRLLVRLDERWICCFAVIASLTLSCLLPFFTFSPISLTVHSNMIKI